MPLSVSGLLMDAIRLIGVPVVEVDRDATTITVYMETTRTVQQLENELRAQMYDLGRLVVNEET